MQFEEKWIFQVKFGRCVRLSGFEFEVNLSEFKFEVKFGSRVYIAELKNFIQFPETIIIIVFMHSTVTYLFSIGLSDIRYYLYHFIYFRSRLNQNFLIIIFCLQFQELMAYGISNILCSTVNCYVSTASLSRSIVQESVGGRTQVRWLYDDENTGEAWMYIWHE